MCATALLGVAPAHAGAAQPADEGRCPEVRRCLDLLEDGIDFIESGRWEAASVVLEEVVAGLEERPPYARDLARAYVYLGVARLQVADAGETRQLFAEAQTRDPTLELGPAEFPRDVLEIWAEARELGGLLVESEPAGAQVSADDVRDRAGVPRTDEPDGMSTTAGRSFGDAAAAAAAADVLTTAERFSADTTKKMGRSMWRTLIGAMGIAAGIVVAGRQCDLDGAQRWEDGKQVETLAGVLQTTRLSAAPYGRSKYVRWWGGCRMRYEFELQGRYGSIHGAVEDHEAMLRDSADALLLNGEQRSRYVEAMLRDSGQYGASFDEQLKGGLAESVGGVRTGLFFPRDRLAGGLALAGLGALLATIWSDGGVVVEEVAVSVTPTGGVLASRSFGW